MYYIKYILDFLKRLCIWEYFCYFWVLYTFMMRRIVFEKNRKTWKSTPKFKNSTLMGNVQWLIIRKQILQTLFLWKICQRKKKMEKLMLLAIPPHTIYHFKSIKFYVIYCIQIRIMFLILIRKINNLCYKCNRKIWRRIKVSITGYYVGGGHPVLEFNVKNYF